MLFVGHQVYSQAGAGGSSAYIPTQPGGSGSSGGGSGGTPQSPTNTYIWLRSDSGVLGQNGILTNGAPIVSWSDRSGNNYGVTNNTLANCPNYIPNIQNGFAAVRGNGTSSILCNTNVSSSGITSWTIFFVFNPGQAQEQYENCFSMRQDTVARWGLQCGNDPSDGIGWAGTSSAVHLGPKALLANQTYTRAYVKSATTWNVYQNGNQIITNLADTSTPSGNFAIGVCAETDLSFGGGAFFLKGDLFEVIVYPVALASTNRIEVETYLKNRYQHY